MAENNSEQERTESASPKRLEDARKQGQVPRSREFAAFLSVFMGLGALMATSGFLKERLGEMMRLAMSFPPEAAKDPAMLFDHLSRIAGFFPTVFLPLALAGVVAALLTPMATNAYVFVPDRIAPKLSNMSPGNWIKKLFSMDNVSEILKSIVKASALALTGYLALKKQFATIFSAPALGLDKGIEAVTSAGFTIIGWLTVILFVVALIDIPLQLFFYAKRLKMSRQELKEESKESEGSPEIKARIRSTQRELARRRMIEDVKKADVVVTNPTHYAVALQYSISSNRAPVVLAKGVDEVAARIREAAQEARVPIVESPKLARALYATTELEREIPEVLYLAVAKVLNYAYALKDFQLGLGKSPKLAELSVPDELDPEHNKTT